MSSETMTHLNTQTLIGYTSKRGHAWHYRASEQGAESNHYEHAVPVEDVTRRLFNWTPIVGPAETTIDGITYRDDTRKTIVRPDTRTILGTFKSGYEPHSYTEWLLGNVEQIMDSGDLKVGSAGLLRGGAVAWVQFEMEDTLGVEGVDFRPFLTAATSLDGSTATTYQMGAQVVVCDNTLHAAMNEGGARRVKFKHTSRSLSRVTDVRDALGLVFTAADGFAAEVEALTAQTVTDREWSRFLDAWTGRSDALASKRSLTIANRTAEELDQLWQADERVAPWAGTAWGVVAATNTHMHHLATVKRVDRATRNTERMVLGMDKIAEQQNRTLKALDLVTA